MPRPVNSHERLDPRSVRLPPPALQRTWQHAQLGIDRSTNTLLILHHVSIAQGFVWAVQISDLVTDDEAREMNAAINDDFVIVTADSAGGMVDIHDRRPVTLSPELAREWLDPGTPKEHAEQIVLLQGEPTEAFEWYPVDRAVGNVRNQGRELIEPVGELKSGQQP